MDVRQGWRNHSYGPIEILKENAYGIAIRRYTSDCEPNSSKNCLQTEGLAITDFGVTMYGCVPQS